jgi:hypothetical protein
VGKEIDRNGIEEIVNYVDRREGNRRGVDRKERDTREERFDEKEDAKGWVLGGQVPVTKRVIG